MAESQQDARLRKELAEAKDKNERLRDAVESVFCDPCMVHLPADIIARLHLVHDKFIGPNMFVLVRRREWSSSKAKAWREALESLRERLLLDDMRWINDALAEIDRRLADQGGKEPDNA